jgi:hypothetical protein
VLSLGRDGLSDRYASGQERGSVSIIHQNCTNQAGRPRDPSGNLNRLRSWKSFDIKASPPYLVE